jgi:hypothetical protein
VLRPPLSTFLALCAAVSLIAYASLEVLPWVRSASYFQPIRVQIEPQGAFGASADGQPTEIAIQIFRGSQLLDEKRIPRLGKAASLPPREPLRLVPLESGGFRVMAGKTSLGELSGDALAAAGVSTEELPSELGPPPDAKPEVDIAETAAPAPVGAAPAERKAAPKPIPPRMAKVRRTAVKRPAQSEADREVELRARASQLSQQGSNCEGERLLRDQGRDERTLALARELQARCRWKGN